ncbi:MAG: GIY-YIG nuclease family protein [Actinomycetota bacterium]
MPGLYAIYGDDLAWAELRLEMPREDLPLYVGKAEDSMVKRDLDTHFGDGRAGSSTVRRSFAALLRTQLSLSGMPRNPAKPGYFSSYGLSPADDVKLTRWMRERLAIAVWPTDASRALVDIEADVLRRWNPAINIAGVTHRWRLFLQAERKVMANQARAWQPASE